MINSNLAQREPQTLASVDRRRVTVLHSIGEWLANTMVWLFDQVRSLDDGIVSHVVCERSRNLDCFRIPNIHTLSSDHPIRTFWGRTMRKAGLSRGLGVKYSIIRQTGASIVHSHFGNYGWMDTEAVRRAGAQHVVTFYGVDVQKLPTLDGRWVERYRDLFSGASVVLCEGPHMARCLARMGCPEKKLRVHHLGVRVSELPHATRRMEPGRPLRVLMCASFTEKKGLPYALDALAQFGDAAPFEATLIGGSCGAATHEKERKAIEDALAKHQFGSRLRLLGFQPYERVIEEIYSHDVFLSPSVTAADGDTEGGAPVTIALAAATGMPVVSTTHCDIPEIVQHDVSALLAPERNAEALAGHLLRLYRNPEMLKALGSAGRSRMVAEFDCVRQGAKLSEIYRAVNAG